MCGIIGVLSYQKFNNDFIEIIKKSMEDIEARGSHSFGYYTYPNNRRFKAVGRVTDYNALETDKRKGDFQVDLKDQHIFLGHTRLATGNASYNKIENNHPFETTDFIMAHNGMIYNNTELRKEFNIKSEVETDSYVIIHLIQHFYDSIKEKDNSERIKKAIERTSNIVKGYFSCWLINKPTGKVFLFKSKSADLAVSYSKKLSSFFFASDSKYYADLLDPLFPKPEGFKELFFGTNDLITVDMDKNAGIVEFDLQKDYFKYDEKVWERSYMTEWNYNLQNNNSSFYGNANKLINRHDDDDDQDDALLKEDINLFFEVKDSKVKLSKEEIEKLTDFNLLKQLGVTNWIINPDAKEIAFKVAIELDSKLASLNFIANNDFVIPVPLAKINEFMQAMKLAYITVYPEDDMTKILKTELINKEFENADEEESTEEEDEEEGDLPLEKGLENEEIGLEE